MRTRCYKFFAPVLALGLVLATAPSAAGEADSDNEAFKAALTALINSLDLSWEVGGKISVGAAVEADSTGNITGGATLEVGDTEVLAWRAEHPGSSLSDDEIKAEVKLEVEAAIVAGVKGGIWADKDEGLFIGAEAGLGAYASASATASFTVPFFGVDTTAYVTAEAHAGAMAEASAVIQIDYDGNLSFEASAGLTVGVGASVTVGIRVPIEDLLTQVGGLKYTDPMTGETKTVEDLEDLIEWASAVTSDPIGYVGGWLTDMLWDSLVAGGWEMLSDIADWIWNQLEEIREAIAAFIRAIMEVWQALWKEHKQPYTPKLGDFM